MKRRILSVLLVWMMMLSLAACGNSAKNASTTFEDFNQFIDKYKREDVEILTTDTENFMDDLSSVLEIGEWDLTEWTLNENISSEDFQQYETDMILFNSPARVYMGTVGDNASDFSISLDLENPDENFSMAVALCEYMFKVYDDASYIRINGENSDEYDLREVFSQEKLTEDFSCSWTFESHKRTNSLYISYRYTEIGSFVSSSFSLSIYNLDSLQ